MLFVLSKDALDWENILHCLNQDMLMYNKTTLTVEPSRLKSEQLPKSTREARKKERKGIQNM